MEKINFCGKKDFILEEVLYENPIAHTKVISVKDNELGRNVILKQIFFENEMQKKLILKEIQNQVYLEEYTDFIPRLHNVFIDNKNYSVNIEMQKITGKSLRSIIEENQSRERTKDWYHENYELFSQICRSMDRIHRAKGFVHKDLKPENIIINRSRSAVYIIDFGISGPGMNKGIGTKKYMAPEQQLRIDKYNVSQATDIYALGQIAIEMFTGETLVYGKELIFNPAGTTWLKEKDISELGIEYYPYLGMIIKRCISMNPKDRYANAGKLNEALRIRKGNHNGRSK